MRIKEERVDWFFFGREKEIGRRNFFYYRVFVLVFRINIGGEIGINGFFFFFFLNVEII